MTDTIFTVQKDGKEIRLTRTQWKHISYRHPEMAGRVQGVKDTILTPTAVRKRKGSITKFYKFLKDEKKYIMVAAKILNHEGFVVTAYITRKIQEENNENERNHL